MKLLFKNSLYSFHLLDEQKPVLFFDWTNFTKDMSYADFQEACHNYAGFAWQYQVKHLLVDTRIFHFQLPENFIAWREEELNPRYYSLAVKKFAYITTVDMLPYMKNIAAVDGKFETKNFISFEDAMQWLNQ
jgi:hypothetical protein